MKINHNFKSFFIFLFFIFLLKNNVAMELRKAIYEKIKNKTPLLTASSMQLSFTQQNNLFTLYVGQKLFYTTEIQDLIKKNFHDSDYTKTAKERRKKLFSILGINNNLKNYFHQNLIEKKYINFSTNFLWYFFSTYAFLLKSERFEKIINSKKYLSLVDKKIKKFVPYFNLIYPFAQFVENKYFERKQKEGRRKFFQDVKIRECILRA